MTWKRDKFLNGFKPSTSKNVRVLEDSSVLKNHQFKCGFLHVFTQLHICGMAQAGCMGHAVLKAWQSYVNLQVR